VERNKIKEKERKSGKESKKEKKRKERNPNTAHCTESRDLGLLGTGIFRRINYIFFSRSLSLLSFRLFSLLSALCFLYTIFLFLFFHIDRVLQCLDSSGRETCRKLEAEEKREEENNANNKNNNKQQQTTTNNKQQTKNKPNKKPNKKPNNEHTNNTNKWLVLTIVSPEV